MRIEIESVDMTRGMRPILTTEYPFNFYEVVEIVDALVRIKMYPKGGSYEEVGKDLDKVMAKILKAAEEA